MNYVLVENTEMHISMYIDRDVFTIQRNKTGRLAGDPPDGITKIDGTPASATVRVLLRGAINKHGDGVVIAEVVSNPDGTWQVDGLPLHLSYDVVSRNTGFNDMILSNVRAVV